MAKHKPHGEHVEKAVKFRFNQHSYLPELSGGMGEVVLIPKDLADKYPNLGDIIEVIEERTEPNDD